MQVTKTALPDVYRIFPRTFGDDRGWFSEVFNAESFTTLGLPGQFVQDNQSFSRKGVLRGLHYQLGEPQGKLVRVLSGHIWDVAVDLRPGSPHFGRWAGFDLRADPLEYLWIPEGFAHGFLVMSETASVLYKTTRYYHPQGERCIRWDDPELAISWPLEALHGRPLAPAVSAKDEQGSSFLSAELPEPWTAPSLVSHR